MTNIRIHSSEISKLKSDSKILTSTAKQIQKDFAMFGVNVPINYESLSVLTIFNELNASVNYLLERDFEKLARILYQVDLPEKQVSMAESEFPDIPLSDLITELIIFREFKKVLTRIKYSSSQKNLDD